MAELAEKPAAAPPRIGKQGDPCVMVIFGAAGDLTGRMLIPALYNLARAGLLSREFAVVGVARTQYSNDEFRAKVHDDVKAYCGECVDDDLWEWFSRRFYYFAGDFGDDKLYSQLKDFLLKIDQDHSAHQNFFYYLAMAPSFFGPIVQKLSAAGLMEQSNNHWRRVVIEKPFGHDLESAKALNQQLLKDVDEKQIYRIDHYLGKETVQNIMAFRFANGIFEPVWNRRYIDHVQISVAETVGVEGRGSYFDHAGSLRDMVPNHIMQLISLTAMEPPISFDANAVRDEQAKILHAIQPMSDEEVLSRSVRGQYGDGTEDGKRVSAYRTEPDVPPDSRTETFVAMKLSDRQLAMGRCPVLSAHGQADASAQYSYRDTVPTGAVRAVPRHSSRTPDAESTGPAHSAGRRNLAAVRGQGPWPGDAPGYGRYEFRISGVLRQAAQHRLRTLAARLHDR